MHCYHSWSYYCDFTFSCNFSFLNHCKFTLNCNFSFLAFLFRFYSCHAHLNILWNLRIINVYYYEVRLEQLKNEIFTDFHFENALLFVIQYAWISKLLRDAASQLSCRLKK